MRQGEREFSTQDWHYSGQWKHELRDGFGVCKWKDGKVYEGNWQRGLMHGRGRLRLDGDAVFQSR